MPEAPKWIIFQNKKAPSRHLTEPHPSDIELFKNYEWFNILTANDVKWASKHYAAHPFEPEWSPNQFRHNNRPANNPIEPKTIQLLQRNIPVLPTLHEHLAFKRTLPNGIFTNIEFLGFNFTTGSETYRITEKALDEQGCITEVQHTIETGIYLPATEYLNSVFSSRVQIKGSFTVAEGSSLQPSITQPWERNFK